MSEAQVHFPAMRREVMTALAALSDVEYQERAWIEHAHAEGRYDDFTLNIHILFDDCQVLPDPRNMIGTVLLEGDEITRLYHLGRVLNDLIDELGDRPDSAYIRHPSWRAVVAHAALSLAAIVRAGGYANVA